MIDHIVWLLIAALLVGISKGGLSSLGALAVPFLALFMNPVFAAALLLPIFIITDMAALWLYRRDFSGRNVAILIPGILFGIAVATVIVPYASEPALLAFTGCVGLWIVWRRWFRRDVETDQPADVPTGLFWGMVSGVTTFITHSGAPPVQAYLLPQNLPRLVFAGTMAITFAVANFAKVPSYVMLGMFDDISPRLVGLLAISGILGTFIGRAIVKRLTDKGFSRVIETLLLVLSVILLVKAGLQVLGG